jgi:hypothetical protein
MDLFTDAVFFKDLADGSLAARINISGIKKKNPVPRASLCPPIIRPMMIRHEHQVKDVILWRERERR